MYVSSDSVAVFSVQCQKVGRIIISVYIDDDLFLSFRSGLMDPVSMHFHSGMVVQGTI